MHVDGDILNINIALALLLCVYTVWRVYREPRKLIAMPYRTAWLLLMFSAIVSTRCLFVDYFVTRPAGTWINPAWLRPATWFLAFIFAVALQYERHVLTQLQIAGVAIYAVGIVYHICGIPLELLGGNITYTMAAFVLLLPFGALFNRTKHKLLYYGAALLNIALIAPRNRTGLVCVAVFGAWYALAYVRRRYRRYYPLLLGLSLVALVALVLMLSTWRTGSIAARFDWQRQALRQWTTAPLSGIGAGHTWLISNYHEHGKDGASFTHNWFVTVLLEQGILGLLAVALMGYQLWRGERHPAATLSLELFAVFSLFNEPWHFWQFTAILTGGVYG